MTPLARDTEKHLSHLPALHLLQQMRPAWTVLTREEADRHRGGRLSNVMLDGILRERLARLNPVRGGGESTYPLAESAITEMVERLKTPRPYGLLRTNEELTDLLLLGTAVEVTVDGQRRSPQLRYIDWETPTNNAFHAVPEFRVSRAQPGQPPRVDIALFVNGIPFAVVECKGPRLPVDRAVDDLVLYQQEDEIPALFRTVQLLLATNVNAVRYGTVGTPKPFWSQWREREDREEDVAQAVHRPLSPPQQAATFADGFANDQTDFEVRRQGGDLAITEQDRVLWALLRPERLLDLARRFTLFDGGVKKAARYQQYFTIRNLIHRVKTEQDKHGRRLGGVVWHTQGSGKSLTMVMLARAIGMEVDAIPNARIVLVTDRVDLDQQLKNTFEACGLSPHRAGTGKQLLDLLESDQRSIVTTVLNKFDTALKDREAEIRDENIFVLVDEAHRGQYGAMFARMEKVLPRACFIGFTGTPILKAEKNTANRFGGIIQPTYTIRQAVEDKAVVRLLYEGRLVDQQVAAQPIDIWFERVCAGLTEPQKARLKQTWARVAKLFQAEQTIRTIAFDVSEHFRRNYQGTPFKGQLVAPSKKAAIQYRDALRELGMVTAEVIISAPAERESDEDSESASAKVLAFWDEMMKAHGNEDEYNKRIIEAFKKREEPEILIVVSKLLTGFDAPRNSVLYLARPLREHTLLQAIARVNRVHEGKDHGLIVDYCAVLEDLNNALTSYEKAGLSGFDEQDLTDIVIPVGEVVGRLGQQNADLWHLFREVGNKQDFNAFTAFLVGDAKAGVRQLFYTRLNEFARTFGLALASHSFANDPDNGERIERYRRELTLFENIRRAMARETLDGLDYGEYARKIEKLLDTYLIADQVREISVDLDIMDEAAVQGVLASNETTRSRADIIASATQRTITVHMDEDPAFYRRFSQMLQAVIDDFRAKRITEAEYLKKVHDLQRKVAGRQADDVPPTVRDSAPARSFYGVVKELLGSVQVPSGTDIATISADAALRALDIVQLHRRVDWAGRSDVENMIKNDLDDYAFDVLRGEYGIELGPAQIDGLIDQILVIARRLVP